MLKYRHYEVGGKNVKKRGLAIVVSVLMLGALFGCASNNTLAETIKVSAQDASNASDAKANELKETPLKEPSDELVQARREALKHTLETGEGCPNCDKEASCALAKEGRACAGTCPNCTKGQNCEHCQKAQNGTCQNCTKHEACPNCQKEHTACPNCAKEVN